MQCHERWREPTGKRRTVKRQARPAIYSLTETKREMEMFSKTETKYKRKSERTKLNSNLNENDFKTKMVTYNVKNRHFSPSIFFMTTFVYSQLFLIKWFLLFWMCDLVALTQQCKLISFLLYLIDLLISIINRETEIKTEIETEIRMI